MFNFLAIRNKSILEFGKTIRTNIYKPLEKLGITGYLSKEPLGYDERTTGEKKTLQCGDKWGDVFDCAWFHFTGSVPSQAKGKHVVLVIDVNGELCIFDDGGTPIQGLTAGSSVFDANFGTPGKKIVDLAQCSQGNEKIDIWADAGCNDLFGNMCEDGRIKRAEIATCNDNIKELYYDYTVLVNLLGVLNQDSARAAQVLEALHQAKTVLTSFGDEEVEKARAILAPQLSKKGGDPTLEIFAIGHAHIDLAWLWPIRETIRKGARTFATAVKSMDKYPDYKFGASQPQLYQWIKDYYPGLYKKVKDKVKEGRWEVQGGMWVESDANVPSGESFVRQFLYGKRFYKEEFGIDVKSLWLPDVFGYSAALPQIIRMCQMDYFMTQKLSWNDTNKFPHHTFIWKGMDGTPVLTHMLPEETYNGQANPASAAKAETNFSQKAISDKCLMLFGIGDGGGGPGEEHLENLKRLKNLNGVAPVKQEFSSVFFDEIGKDTSKYPQWQGELYLEKHRGTYTTQAKNKRFNRKMEIALHNLELIACIAKLNGFEYPQEQIDTIWKEVLLYQFHDILPGSSIKRVYDESVERYEKILKQTEELTAQALAAVCQAIDTSGTVAPAVVFNTLSWDRNEWINFDGKWYKPQVSGIGYAVIDTANADAAPQTTATTDTLENDVLKVTFDADGAITSIYDKQYGTEAIQPGCKGNVLNVYQDDGDAWDFSNDYKMNAPDQFILKNTKAYVDGPQAIVEQTYEYGKSSLTQKIILTAGSRRLDFVTQANWQETFKMLRASVPVSAISDTATCDIQFGSIKRPTHTNTSWDKAKLEICAHKFVDISQSDYGVAMLNDCKYGFCVAGNVLDVNLLRSPMYPGIDADKGSHDFTYSIYPHKGGYIEGEVAKAAYELNTPLIIAPTASHAGSMQKASELFTIDNDAVVIETVKKSQDCDAIIVRMYETHGTSTKALLKTSLKLNAASLTDGLEEKICDVACDNGRVELSFRPREIKTVELNIG